MKKLFLTLSLVIAVCMSVAAQPHLSKVQVILVPDRADALYHVGEKVKMKLMTLDCGVPINDAVVDYEVSEDLMPVRESNTVKLKGYETTINIGTMKKPGYLRVKAKVNHEGKTYTTLSTVGFDTDKLVPTVTMPDDFRDFWNKNLEIAKKLDVKPEMELLADRCTKKVNVYHVSYANINGSRMYGVLTMPVAEGKYPAILRLPGAGVARKGGDIARAEKGVIILELGIHGIPVNLNGSVYSDLENGVLSSYYVDGMDNRDTYFYKRVYMGCVRGVDFLLSLPQCNGKIGTLGGSQGGALSIVTSSLDSRVAATAVYFPAFCDMEAYTHGRAGGWPHVFKFKSNCTKEKLNTARYYDASNFARGLKAPVYYAFGYNDITCAPTSTQSTYNVITAPKQVNIGENIGHWLFPEQNNAMWDWIIAELKKQ